jgi:uncharacterized protein (DUF2384 family)
MSLVALDLRHPDLVARELGEANARLSREREVPTSIVGLISDLAEQIADADSADLQAIDPYLWIELQQAALRAQAAAHDDDSDVRRRRIRISLEQLRFLLTRLAERQPVAEDRPVNDVARWLDQVLAVPQHRKAELLGVGTRTFQRWIGQKPTRPEPEDERALRMVARIASQLRHSLGGIGIVDWFEHPLDELGGRRPRDLVRESESTEQLLSLAVGSRSSAAS